VPSIFEARPDLGAYPSLLSAIGKACEKEPSARHQSAAELRDDLAAALGPAFMLPPGATPAPAPSLEGLTPLQLRELLRTPAQAGGARTRALAILKVGRLKVSRLFLERVPRAARNAFEHVRARPVRWGGVALALATLAGGIGYSIWSHGRAASEARALLAANRAAEARAILDDALEHRSDEPDLLLLRAHALHRTGRHAEDVEAYAVARTKGPLDDDAYTHLVSDLGRERSLADRAARVLRDEGTRAVPALLRAASTASGNHRLRALTLARDLGAEDQIDRVAAYGGLLGDPDCELRRAAARRLGELGDAAALPALRKAAQAQVAKTEPKGGLWGGTRTKNVPACGAPEADAAAKRIEAARLPPAK
jgi:serine/threonine-protein kinase